MKAAIFIFSLAVAVMLNGAYGQVPTFTFQVRVSSTLEVVYSTNYQPAQAHTFGVVAIDNQGKIAHSGSITCIGKVLCEYQFHLPPGQYVLVVNELYIYPNGEATIDAIASKPIRRGSAPMREGAILQLFKK